MSERPGDSGSVRITNQMMYTKLVELSEKQIEILAELHGLKDLPERLRLVELAQARTAWIEKIAFTALGSAIIGLGTALFSLIVRV
jgi:hypothetical protein